MIKQTEIILPEYSRGLHIITHLIESKLSDIPDTGLLHLLLKHTSAAITINENADPSVRTDMESYLERFIPENEPYYTHVYEGADDMPAHIKASLIGQTLTIPITNRRLNLGNWQGIYLCEFRNSGGRRRIVLTVYS